MTTSGSTQENHTVARISGVDLPREKRVEVALTYIYGIGRTRADQTLKATGVNPDTRVKDLTEDVIDIISFIAISYGWCSSNFFACFVVSIRDLGRRR